MHSVMIDGTKYVPATPEIVDCDGHEIRMGERVYVRESVLGNYAYLNHDNRHGILNSATPEGTLTIGFDNGNTFTFKVREVRRSKFQ